MEKASVTKIEIDDKTYYIKVLWKPNGIDIFAITIYDGNTSWSGKFSCVAAEKYRERFDESEEEYFNSVKKGLSRDPNFRYVFEVKPGDDKTATFSWKKKFEDGHALLVHGSVAVHRDEINESKDYLVDFLLAENGYLRDTIDCLNKHNGTLNKDLEKCKTDLDQFIEVKTSLEASLYSKFVQLLSAKKRRIELLENSISNSTP